MCQFSPNVLLKNTISTLLSLCREIGGTNIIHKSLMLIERKQVRKTPPFLVAYIDPSQRSLPGVGTSYLITEAQPEFVELNSEKDVINAVVEARQNGRMIAVLRNDAAMAKATLKRILNELSHGCYVNTEFEDLRTIVDSADIMSNSNCVMLPNVMIGSGTARGDNAGMRALEIAIINAEFEHVIRSKKVNGIFLTISMSQSYKKLSVQTGIKSALRKKIGFEPFTLYDTSTDDTLGEAVRVTLLAAI